MSNDGSTLTGAYLRQVIRYEAETGELFWRRPRRNQKRGALGAPAGHGGRLQTPIGGKAHYVHRLVWLYHHDAWPADQLDHINGNKLDNRIENLREATGLENLQNRWVGNAGTRGGLLGVSWDGRKVDGRPWRARIMRDGRSTSLGYYPTPEEAHEAYLAAKSQVHPFWSGHRVA